jgi:hypothetical protein
MIEDIPDKAIIQLIPQLHQLKRFVILEKYITINMAQAIDKLSYHLIKLDITLCKFCQDSCIENI